MAVLDVKMAEYPCLPAIGCITANLLKFKRNARRSVNVITLISNWHPPCFIMEQTDQRIFGGEGNHNSQIDKEIKRRR